MKLLAMLVKILRHTWTQGGYNWKQQTITMDPMTGILLDWKTFPNVHFQTVGALLATRPESCPITSVWRYACTGIITKSNINPSPYIQISHDPEQKKTRWWYIGQKVYIWANKFASCMIGVWLCETFLQIVKHYPNKMVKSV